MTDKEGRRLTVFRDTEKLAHLEYLRDVAHDTAKTWGKKEDDARGLTPEELEAVFTSTDVKLMNHPDRIAGILKGEYRPINVQIAPTNLCNMECNFCSTSHRDARDNGLPIDALFESIDALMEVGPLKSAEVTGGGDPTMYKPLPKLIGHLHDRGVDVGMITNGLLLRNWADKEPDMLDKLTWLRVSLAFMGDKNYYSGAKKVDTIDIPKIKGDIGLSYVWAPTDEIITNPTLLAEDLKELRGKLDRIAVLKAETGARFVRIVPDCHNPRAQDVFKAEVSGMIKEYNGFFPQKKDYAIHNVCRVGFLKPFLNADGYFYQCSATPLYTGEFSEKWRIGHMSEVRDIWPTGWKDRRMDTSSCHAGMCFYATQNKTIGGLEVPVPHKNFV